MQQVFGHLAHRLAGQEESQQPRRQQITRHDQRAGQQHVEQQARLDQRAQPIRTAGADELRAEDRRRDGNRQRRKLHVVDDLVHRAIRRRGVGAVAVDQAQNRQLGQRDGDHLHTGRHANAQHAFEQRRVDPQRAAQGGVGRQRVALALQVDDQKRQRHRKRHQPGHRRAHHAQLRQAAPAADQRWRQHQANAGGQHQRVQRRQRVAHAAQQLRVKDEHQQQRHGQHHHAGVGHGVGQHLGRRAQRLQHLFGEQLAQHRRRDADQPSQPQRGAGNRLHLGRLTRAPGLADQHRSARAHANDERDEEKHDGEHARHRRQRLRAQHLPDVDRVDAARQRLQDVGQHHGAEERQVNAPQGARGVLRRHRRSCHDSLLS